MADLQKLAGEIYQAGIRAVHAKDPANAERCAQLAAIAHQRNDPSMLFASQQLAHLTELGYFPAIEVMGVMGSGKSSIAKLLAKILEKKSARRVVFKDGDDFHPDENIAQMRKQLPLNDQQRIAFYRNGYEFLAAAEYPAEVRITCLSALGAKHRAALLGRYKLGFQDPEFCAATLDESPAHWLPSPRLKHVLILCALKPYAVTLAEMDHAAKHASQDRLFRGQVHFAQATYERPELLQDQYANLRVPPPWLGIGIEVCDYRTADGRYDSTALERRLREIVGFS
jgi:hypothetical protein